MHDVLVIGAGPTGLYLAYLLKKQGVNVRIIEKDSGTSTHSKALVIHPRTLEMLDKESIVKPFLEAGLNIKSIQFHYGKKAHTLDLCHSPSPFPFVDSLPQTETEKILLSLLEQEGVQVEWNTEVTHFENGFPVDQNSRSLEAKWIIGCDGAHSVTRKSHDYTFEGKSIPMHIFLADVDADTDYNPEMYHFFLTKKTVAFLFPIGPKRFRVMFAQHDGRVLSEEEVKSRLPALGFQNFTCKNFHWLQNFHLSMRMVQNLRRGNVFIIGDAAHVHTPLGGHGMNTCMQDAHNLAWKLALVVKGAAPDKILDTYSEERIPVITDLLNESKIGTKLLGFSAHTTFNLLFKMVGIVFSLPKLRKKALNRLLMTHVHYKDGVLFEDCSHDSGWKAPKCGHWCPDFQLEDGSNLRDHLRTSKFVLLHFGPHPKVVECAKNHWGEFVETVHIKGEKARTFFKAKPDTVFVVRPDGYIGFRSKDAEPRELDAYFKRFLKTPVTA
ncbi:MAG: FAD-dependent monooxygenase [Chlamydiales bacterium]|nr:FAD-dependent monooxygenase [Chlamydiales bacterium]